MYFCPLMQERSFETKKVLKSVVRRWAGVCVCLALATVAHAQGTVKGFLKSEASGEAVMFASVTLEGTNYGVSSDVSGYYSLSRIPAGQYTLVVTSLEYETVREVVSISNDRVLTRNLLLQAKVVTLEGAEVRADREEQTTQVRTSVETIRPADIKRIPSFGGAPDLVQALQVLPGFVSSGDQGGQLYIRGGSPVQNKVLLDGMLIYNAFHSIGLFSVFDSDALSNADVYTGAFSAKYGGRISSVMDIRTRDGNMVKTEGKVGGQSIWRQGVGAWAIEENAGRQKRGHQLPLECQAQLFGAVLGVVLSLHRRRSVAFWIHRHVWQNHVWRWRRVQDEPVWVQFQRQCQCA